MSEKEPLFRKPVFMQHLPDKAPGLTAVELADKFASGDKVVRDRLQIALSAQYLMGRDVERAQVPGTRGYSYWKIEGRNSHWPAVARERGYPIDISQAEISLRGAEKAAQSRRENKRDGAGCAQNLDAAPQPTPQPAPSSVGAEPKQGADTHVSAGDLAFKPVAAIIDSLSDALARMLIERTLVKVNERLPLAMTSFLASSSDSTQEKVQKPAEVESERRMKIAVVGLLPGQQKMIAEQFKEVNFHFPDKNNSKQLKQAAMYSEYVVMMAGFVNHGTQNTLKSKGANLILEHGGMDGLRRQVSVLTKVAQNQPRHH